MYIVLAKEKAAKNHVKSSRGGFFLLLSAVVRYLQWSSIIPK